MVKNPDTKKEKIDPFDNLKFFNFAQKLKNLQTKTPTKLMWKKNGNRKFTVLNTTIIIISGKNRLCMLKFIGKRIFAYAQSNSLEDIL